jgi:hypothetical protein
VLLVLVLVLVLLILLLLRLLLPLLQGLPPTGGHRLRGAMEPRGGTLACGPLNCPPRAFRSRHKAGLDGRSARSPWRRCTAADLIPFCSERTGPLHGASAQMK